jgi:hypothetical protein
LRRGALKSTAGAKPGQFLRVPGTVLKTSETQRAVQLMRDILGLLALPEGGRRERVGRPRQYRHPTRAAKTNKGKRD